MGIISLLIAAVLFWIAYRFGMGLFGARAAV
jgi:hypothetical protein